MTSEKRSNVYDLRLYYILYITSDVNIVCSRVHALWAGDKINVREPQAHARHTPNACTTEGRNRAIHLVPNILASWL